MRRLAHRQKPPGVPAFHSDLSGGRNPLYEEILRDLPLRYWPLDESYAATVVYDESGNAGNMAITGPPWLGARATVTHARAQARWNASNQQASAIVTNSGLSQFALEAWVYPEARNGSPYIESVIGCETEGGSANPTILLRLGNWNVAGDSGKPQVLASNGTALIGASGPNPINLNEGHHLAGICDGTTLSMLVDGYVVGSSAWSGVASFNHAQGVYISVRKHTTSSPDRRFFGGIAHAALYDHFVTVDRMRAHFEAGRRSRL